MVDSGDFCYALELRAEHKALLVHVFFDPAARWAIGYATRQPSDLLEGACVIEAGHQITVHFVKTIGSLEDPNCPPRNREKEPPTPLEALKVM